MSSPTREHAHGDLAQLVEHLLCKQGVRGSIPLVSTMRFCLRESDCIPFWRGGVGPFVFGLTAESFLGSAVQPDN